MPDVFDGDGNLIADIPISEKQLTIIEEGAEVAVIFHTPQRLHYLLGERRGSFSLRKTAGRIVSREPKLVKEFAELQAAITGTRTD